MRGRLEFDIRSLPQVIACTSARDDIVVLVSADAHRADIERSVRALAGDDLDVRVLGGIEPTSIEVTQSSLGRWAMLSGAAAVSLAFAVGSISDFSTERPGPEPPRAEAPAPSRAPGVQVKARRVERPRHTALAAAVARTGSSPAAVTVRRAFARAVEANRTTLQEPAGHPSAAKPALGSSKEHRARHEQADRKHRDKHKHHHKHHRHHDHHDHHDDDD